MAYRKLTILTRKKNARAKITSTARQGGDRPNDNSEYCNSNSVNEWGVYSSASAEFQLAG